MSDWILLRVLLCVVVVALFLDCALFETSHNVKTSRRSSGGSYRSYGISDPADYDTAGDGSSESDSGGGE
jgi:hypothetical protein